MKPTFIALLALCLCLGGCKDAEDKKIAAEKWDILRKAAAVSRAREKAGEDILLMKALAERGDSWAQHNLGIMYYDGEQVEKDFKEAVKWLRKAAEKDRPSHNSTLWLFMAEARKTWRRISRKR